MNGEGETEELLANHLREHGLMSEEHRREHDGLLREVAGAAIALENRVRETAANLAKQLADTAGTLETRVREVAELHWDNHRVEHISDQRAIDKVERNMTDKFASVNEFREQQKDIIGEFPRRESVDAQFKALTDRIDQNRAAVVGSVSREEFMAALAQRDAQITSLNTFRDQQGGVKQGSAPYTAIIFSVLGAVLSALAVGAVVLATKTP